MPRALPVVRSAALNGLDLETVQGLALAGFGKLGRASQWHPRGELILPNCAVSRIRIASIRKVLAAGRPCWTIQQWHPENGRRTGECFRGPAIVDAFSEIFDRLDRELWVITARAGDKSSGLIASYVSRVSLVPTLPRVTIALAKHHFTHELIEATGAFCMHLVGEDSLDWVWRFGISSGREVDKLRGLALSSGVSGSPILTDAPAWLDCRVEARMDTGDRTVYLAEVMDARIERTATPLTFKRMLELAPPERLREMKQALEGDMELDRAAILGWRQGRVPADL